MSSSVKDGNYILIQSWMISDLKLKGNELLIYAIIYGFSQTNGTAFTGSLQYLAEWTNSTKQGVLKNLKSLMEKGLIKKVGENSQKQRVFYKAYKVLNKVDQSTKVNSEEVDHSTEFNGTGKQSLIDQSTKFNGTIKQSLPNNIDIINNNINNTTTSESENLSQETTAKDDSSEESSSSFSSEKDLIKDILYQHGLDKPTIDNILKLEKVTLARAKIVLNYAIAQKWNAGAIYLAFKENWNCDNFSSSKMTVETALTETEARKKIKERANYWLDYYEMTGNYQYCKLSFSNDLKKYTGFENICQEYLQKFENFCKNN